MANQYQNVRTSSLTEPKQSVSPFVYTCRKAPTTTGLLRENNRNQGNYLDMRTTFATLSLTLLPLLLPFSLTIPSTGNSENHDTAHEQCFHARQHANSQQLSFGKELGKYIKDNGGVNGNYSLKTLVIDPGHGGRDPGTSGRFSREKHLTLGISKILGDLLRSAYPDLKIIYTRTDDTFVPLHVRASIANKNQADLFLSIHCNYMPNASHIRGTETYVMGLHTTDYNLEVAKRENASILLEENYDNNYGGYDPNSPEGHIILSMFQNAFLEQSISFADKLENRFAQSGNRHSRGVKQAGFAVLKSTTMPSVLVETGFLSNSDEEKFLTTPSGQETIARSIAEAFIEYKNEIEGNNEPLPLLTARTPKLDDKAAVQKTESSDPSGHQDQEKSESLALNDTSPKEEVQETETSAVAVSEQNVPATDMPEQETLKGPPVFKVLILQTRDPANVRHLPWEKVRDLIEIRKASSTYAYFATGFTTYEAAVEAKENLRMLGFQEAFVVAFQDGQRVPVAQARENSKR